MEIIENESGAFALILMDGLEYLLQVDLASPSNAMKIELPAAPIALDVMPDGRFVIAHDLGMGMVSFLNPSDLSLTSVQGFATFGLFEKSVLTRRTEGE